MTDDPDFYAWLDGELAEPEASAMAARVASDPTLADLAAQHRALSGRLSAAFASVLVAPLPEKIRRAAETRTAEVVDLAAARAGRRPRWSVTALAAAASLALGLTLGVLIPSNEGSFRSIDGQLLAAGTLEGALSNQLASAGEAHGVRIALSFRDDRGRFCRSFAAEAQSGLACRTGEAWVIEGLIAAPEEQGDYRMAAGPDPALATLIDQRLSGDPLDEAGEKAARASGWR